MILKEPDSKMQINFLIHQIHHRWKRIADQKMLSLGLDAETIASGRLLRYLYSKSEEEDIFQKTIEKDTGFTKSGVSGMLSILEEKKYIERRSMKNDARLKKIVITDAGKIVFQTIVEAFDYTDSCFSDSLNDSEQQMLIRLLNRINTNIMAMEDNIKT